MSLKLGDLYVQIGANIDGLKDAGPALRQLAKEVEKVSDATKKLAKDYSQLEMNLVRHEIAAGKMKIAEEARIAEERIAEMRRVEKEAAQIEMNIVRHEIEAGRMKIAAEREANNQRISEAEAAAKRLEQLELNTVKHEIEAGRAKIAREDAINKLRIQQAIENNKKFTEEQDRISNPAKDSAGVFENHFKGLDAAIKANEEYTASVGKIYKSAKESASVFQEYYDSIDSAKLKQAVEVNKKLVEEQDRVKKSAKESAGVFEKAFAEKEAQLLNERNLLVENAAKQKEVDDARLYQAIETNRKITAEQDKVLKSARESAYIFKNSDPTIKMRMFEIKSDVKDKLSDLIVKIVTLTGGVKTLGTIAKGSFNIIIGSVKKAASIIGWLTDKIFSLKSALLLGGAAWGFKKIIDLTAKFEGLVASMTAVTGSVKKAQEELAFIQNQAVRLGLDISDLSEQYTKFSASTKNTAIEGNLTKRVFLSLAEAARVLQMSTDDTHGAFRALSQIVSKGKLSAEELRQQLGDRLYGAFEMAAVAMGKTTDEFDRLLRTGQVNSMEFLPKLADELIKRYGDALPLALQKATAEFERVKNEMVLIGVALGNSGILQFAKELAIEIQNYLRPLRSILKQLEPYLNEKAKNFFDKKTPEEYFNIVRSGFASFVRFIGNLLGKVAEFTNATINSAYQIRKAFYDMIPGFKDERLKQLQDRLKEIDASISEQRQVSMTFEGDLPTGVQVTGTVDPKLMKARQQIAEEIAMLQGRGVYIEFDLRGYEELARMIEETNYQQNTLIQGAKDFDGPRFTGTSINKTSEEYGKLLEKIRQLQREAGMAAGMVNAMGASGTVAATQLNTAFGRMDSSVDIEKLVPMNKGDIIAAANELGITFHRSFYRAAASETALKNARNEVVSAVSGMVDDKNASDIAKGILSDLNKTEDQISAVSKLDPWQKFMGFFDSGYVDKLTQTNLNIENTRLELDKLSGTQPGKIDNIVASIKRIGEATGKDFFHGVDPSTLNHEDKLKAIATAAEEAKTSGDSLKTSFSEIGSVVSNVFGQIASMAGQITSMYEQQASYHAQMAQEALAYGQSQSDLYMRLADSVRYSNNAQAQSFEQRALASAQAASDEYAAHQKLRQQANAQAKAAFENQKKLSTVQAISATAVAVMDTYKNSGLGVYAAPLAGVMAALGAAQVAIIQQQQFTPRAKGGSITGGKPYLVGEKGPELIVPGQGGTVVNNSDLMDSIGGGGGVNVHFHINAADASGFGKLLLSHKGMIVNMFREAVRTNMRESPV